MHYDVAVSSLDELNTPVIICSTDGLVIYKNEAAVKEVRLPKRRTHVQPHLHPDDARTLASLGQMRKPCMMTVNTGERKVRAFVTAYERKGKPCSLWVFPAIIQINSKTRYTYCIESGMTDAADDVCDVVKAIDERSLTASPRTKASIDKRLKKKADNVLVKMFGGDQTALYPLVQGLTLLTDAASRTFGKFGYDIRNEFSGIRDKDGAGSYIDFKSFSLFYYHLLAFFIECGAGGMVNVRFTRNNDRLDIRLVLSMPYPPYYTENESDLTKLAELSPTNIIDLLVFEKFSEYYGYNVSFTINENHLGNLAVFASVPIVGRMEFRESAVLYPSDELLLEGDVTVMYYFMLRFRGIRTDNRDE